MADRNSQIIMCKNIKLDRNYNNVLNYTEAQMLSLCRANQVASASNYSFIRERGTIKTHFPYAQCLQSNYIAFQNSDYSNKWFFAWIDEVTYKSDGTGELSFTIDIWSTWFRNITLTQCVVEREHVNNDTIGLHTLEEGLNVGDVVEESTMELLNSDIYLIIESTYNLVTNRDVDYLSQFNGNFSGSIYYVFSRTNILTNVTSFLRDLASESKISSILNMFIAPKILVDEIGTTAWGKYTILNETSTSAIEETLDIIRQESFSDYTPKNNKLLCYPYNYMIVSNNVGNNLLLKYENFEWEYDKDIQRNVAQVLIEMAFSIGSSIRLIPKNYKKISKNYDESLPLAKFPTCSWSADSFTNWLTSQAVNISTDVVATGISIASGNVVGSLSSMAGMLGQFYSASLLPSIHGGNNVGDVNYSAGKNTFIIHHMRAKTEYLKIIDDYFTKFGYKILETKIPNITGRSIFNYVKILNGENIGYGIQNKELETINEIFRSGVTIWHNHANIGNYNLNNSIVQ